MNYNRISDSYEEVPTWDKEDAGHKKCFNCINWYLGLRSQKHECIPYFLAHKTHFFPQICDLNSTCVLCAESKYYFQTYKYPYIFLYEESDASSENNHEDDFSGSDNDFLGFCDE